MFLLFLLYRYHTDVQTVAKKITRAITEYEEAEAERRAVAILEGSLNEAEELGQRRDVCKKKLRGTVVLLNEVKVSEFKDAVLETSLNGFLYPEVVELEVAINNMMEMLTNVEERANRMPERQLDLKENMVKRFEREVETLTKHVEKSQLLVQNEMEKRTDTEKRSVQAKKMAEVRARQNAATTKKKLEDDEKNRKEALDKLDAEYARAEEQAEKEANDRQEALVAEREKMKKEKPKSFTVIYSHG